MIFKTRALAPALFAAALFVGGCESSGSGPAPDPGPAPQEAPLPEGAIASVQVFEYSRNGSLLTLQPVEPKEITQTRCETDTTDPVTLAGRIGVSQWDWAIVDDSLRINMNQWTLTAGQGASATASQAVVEKWSSYARYSGTTGLEGSWQYAGERYRVAAGSIDSAYAAKLVRWTEGSQESMAGTLTFHDGRVKDVTGFKPASQFLVQWNGIFLWRPTDTADGAKYAIDVDVRDARHVRMTGLENDEIVEIAWTEGEISYTSSDASHAPHVFKDVPTTCPNNFYPIWWTAFKEANRGSD